MNGEYRPRWYDRFDMHLLVLLGMCSITMYLAALSPSKPANMGMVFVGAMLYQPILLWHTIDIYDWHYGRLSYFIWHELLWVIVTTGAFLIVVYRLPSEG